MKKLLLIIFAYIFSTSISFASHIVGGEFEMVSLGNNNYKVSLHLYSDDINGNPDAIDPDVWAFIYSKSNNQFMSELWLPKVSTSKVNYSNIECQDQRLKTSHIIYSNTITLNPNYYNDPKGYYIVWERCCRNSTIVNIEAPSEAGQTFYLEFPPVNVVNSSPRLFPPLSDYACLGTPFNFDFAATDSDGDSLVYTLVTPLKGSSSSIDPAPYPPSVAPYTLIKWQSGYSETFQVPGNPTLDIGRSTGALSLTPTSLGLHVFAVKCEEYRDGKKIGEVRREFQLMVLDCPDNEKPTISFLNPDSNSPYLPGDTILLDDTKNQFDFVVRDTDQNDKLKIEAKAINFAQSQLSLSITSGTVNSFNNPSDSLNCSLYINTQDIACEGPYQVRLIVKDNACSVPASDTLLVTFKYVEKSPKEPAILYITDAEILSDQPTTVKVQIGSSIQFNVFGEDGDMNSHLLLTAQGNDFELPLAGMSFPKTEGRTKVSSPFSWNTSCEYLEYLNKPLTVEFKLTEQNCNTLTQALTYTFELIDTVAKHHVPYNVVTPNGDNKNEYFSLEEVPLESCAGNFQFVEIYNRWGLMVFKDTRENFRWAPEKFSSGTFYYYIKFDNKDLRGWVSVLK
jgi:hypothetical protein